MARLFIAVDVVPGPPLEHVLEALDRMGRAVKSVSPGQLHLTLRFLGEVTATAVPTIERAMEAAVRGMPPFELQLTSLGAFPSAQRPSVIWAGIEQPQGLTALADALDAALADAEGAELAPRDKPFQAHLTLARVKAKPPADLSRLLDGSRAQALGAQHIDRVVLYESELRPEGPVYTQRAAASLMG